MKTEVTEHEELYTLRCYACQEDFQSDKPYETFCPKCTRHIQSRIPKEKKKEPKKPLTLAEVMHIAKVYNRVNNQHLHYGELVALLDKNSEHCICCGVAIPEGRQVCPQCEKAVK